VATQLQLINISYHIIPQLHPCSPSPPVFLHGEAINLERKLMHIFEKIKSGKSPFAYKRSTLSM
jgi:hypothetical protein